MEAEYQTLLSVDLERLTGAERCRANDRFKRLTESPFDFIRGGGIAAKSPVAEGLSGARSPRTRDPRQKGGGAQPQARANAAHGRGTISNLFLGVISSDVDLSWPGLSYRGQLLVDVEQIIGNEMVNKAWETMAAKELREYGLSLKAAHERFAPGHHLELAERTDEPWPDPTSPQHRASVLADAAAWCLWWSARGFGLFPDY